VRRATVGIALAGNLLTFLVFYEMLTLATYPLIVHRGTTRRCGRASIYLAYTLGGGAAAAGRHRVAVRARRQRVEFLAGGVLAALASRTPAADRRSSRCWSRARREGRASCRCTRGCRSRWSRRRRSARCCTRSRS
jgi:hypothetical protein